jgi:PAS domain S-box-containing protein
MDTTAAQLLSLLARLAADCPPALPPLETGRQLLRRGLAAVGAAGGLARLVDVRGEVVEIVEAGAAGRIPARASELAARAQVGWLSDAAAAVGTVASVGVTLGADTAAVVLWFDGERRLSDVERAFLTAFGQLLAREVDRSRLGERQRAEALANASLLQKLARSEEQLRVALEAGQLGAWDWEIPDGKVTWSAMLERIHGLDAGAFEGTFEAYQRDIHPDDRARVLATIGRAVAERTDHHVVYRIVRPDGQGQSEERWLEAHGRLICDGAGAPQRLVGVCVDVTERRRTEEQLRQVVLALREADQRKDHFLAMLAHELRNPLGPMLNATYLLRAPEVDAEVAARAREIIDRQVQHMARLLEDLLDVSRITRGKVDLVREPVDTAALTRQVVGDHLDSFQAALLALDLVVTTEPLFVHGDRARIAQIVGNLLSNALKFSQPGQTVWVRVERAPVAESLVLTVRDEGAGIEPAFLGSIFEPFMQADNSLSRGRGGLGLGLAVVQGLVALHGGRVSASSGGEGQGAELRVELPLYLPQRDAPAPVRAEPEPQPPARALVLVFEDNADAAESLRIVLSAAGYHVEIAATGHDATAVVRRVRPAIVLCDLGLPDQDGYAIAAQIRADSALAPLPLIAISGYGTAEDQARSRRAGFDLHLTKPVPPALLLSELSRRLEAVTERI